MREGNMKKTAILIALVILAGLIHLPPSGSHAEEELRDFENNARWYFVSGEYETASPIYKIVDAVVGVPVKVKFFVQNNQKVNVSYRLGFDLTDNGNRESWMEGDRKSLQLDRVKFTLKPGQKQDVIVTVTVNKSHSGHAFWTFSIIPDRGVKDNVFLYICQYDTKGEITSNYLPPKVKTMSELLKYKTKIGYIVRTDCFTVIVYGNKHVYCFNKDRSRRWAYSNDKAIQDIYIIENDSCDKESLIYFDNVFLNPVNGSSSELNLASNGRHGTRKYLLDQQKVILISNYDKPSWLSNSGECMLICKQYMFTKVYWTQSSDLTNYLDPYVFRSVQNRLLVFMHQNWVPNPGSYVCFDSRNGVRLFEARPGSIYGGFTHIDDKNKIFIAGGLGVNPRGNNKIEIWDVEACKNTFQYVPCGSTHASLSGDRIVFSDLKSTSCYDYLKRKMLWTLKGDGAPLCAPFVDEKQEFFYLLDEDSIWVAGERQAKRITAPKYVRLYKFNLKSGKQVWHKNIYTIPNEVGSFYEYEYENEFFNMINAFDIEEGIIKIELDVEHSKKNCTFTIRASDGKPAK